MAESSDWFHNVILDGLQALKVVGLVGEPAAGTLRAVLRIWRDALWPTKAWSRELDEPRLREAFRRLTVTADRWPVPEALLRQLPPRPYRHALPPPVTLTEKQRRRRHRQMKDFIARCRQ